MSLLDVLDNFGGGSLGGSPSRKLPSFDDSSFAQPSTGYSSSSGAAASSQERGTPERVDINNFVKSSPTIGQQPGLTDQLAGGATQALGVAGKAPGFIAERPLAVADTLGQSFLGVSPVQAAESVIGQIPILGGLIGGAGDALHNLSSLPAAIANSSEAESLKRGTLEGWSDDTMLSTGLAGIERLIGAPPGAGTMTWGQFKEEARKKGWTADDIQSLIDGKKSSFDFGDHRMSSDALTEMGLRLASDPSNLLFGAGAALKLGKGVSLLADAVKAGAELEKPLSVSLAAEAAANGIAKESTWMGIAQYFGQVGRGIGAVPGGTAAVQGLARGAEIGAQAAGAYRKVAIGTTAAQVGIGIADNVLNGSPDENGNRPHSGFLEPLFDLNRKAWDNRPLSDNTIFSLWSAFHFPIHEYVGKAKDLAAETKYRALGSDVRPKVIQALGEGWGASKEQVLERIGGADALDNLITHVHSQIAFQRILKNPVVKAALSHYDSLDEAVLANRKVAEMVKTALVDDYKNNRISGTQTVQQLRDWFANRAEGGKPLNSVEFPWHGGDAIDRWVEYGSAAGPIADIYRERGNAVLGLRDTLLAEDLQHAGLLMKQAATDGKNVPLREVRSLLSRFPQLLQDESWQQYLLKDAPESVPLGPIYGKLKRAAKEAPTARELTHEAAAAETEAAKHERANPIDDQTIADAVDNGSATIAVSRMRPKIARQLGLAKTSLTDVQHARTDPTISTFEENVGPALQDAGFNVDHVSQSLGSWKGEMEPSVEIAMTKARLPELRLAAATLGKLGEQDSVALSVSGARMRQMGLKANGFEVVIQLPSTSRGILQNAAERLSKDFDGFTLNDTTGTVRILVDGAKYDEAMAAKLEAVTTDLEGLFPRDLIGDTGLRTSHHPAYVEFLNRKKADGTTYTDAIRDARDLGDPRAGASRAIGEKVSYTRGGTPHAGSGVGSGEAVGRLPGPDAGPGDPLALTPAAERVGLGRVEDAVKEDGYLYHTTDLNAARDIAGDKLRPFGPEYRAEQLYWPDGGAGKRIYFNRDPQKIVGFQPDPSNSVLLRVKESRAGRVRDETWGGDSFATRAIDSSRLEIFGGDGQWHPMDSFFEPPLPPELEAAARDVAPAYAPKRMSIAELKKMAVADLDKMAASPNHAAQIDRLAEDIRKNGLQQPLELKEYDGKVYLAEGHHRLLALEKLGATDAPISDPNPGPLAAALRATEDTGWVTKGTGVPMDEAPLREELARLSRKTVLEPADVERAQQVQRNLEAAILAKGEARRGQVLYNAARDAAVSEEFPLHRSLADVPEVQRADLARLEAELQANYPTYTVKRPPKLSIFDPEQGDIATRYLRDRTKLGEALADWGPLGRVNRFVDWLTSPVPNERLGQAARQALFNELLPKGATVKEVDSFLKALSKEAGKHTFGPMQVRAFRGPTSLGAQLINKVAAGDPEVGLAPIFSQKAIAAIGRDNFAKVLDRASNRFMRTVDEAAKQGGPRGQLARALGAAYGGFQDSAAGGANRYVSKTMYHWFRFLSDPRWWAMNMVEADMIGGLRYGMGATRFTGAHRAEAGAPSLIHQFGEAAGKRQADLNEALRGEETGWLYTRHLGGYVSRAFDAQRPASTIEVLKGLEATDPILQDLKKIAGSDNPIDLAKEIDGMLYSWDTKGPRTTLLEQAEHDLGTEEMTRLLPFLQKVWERHEATYEGIVQTFHGNGSRSNLERIANSYWLYWPLSYQLKASKWLIDTMTHRFGGMDTNLAPAALYAHHYEEHKKRMASDPDYVKVFEDHPTAWFLAQMLFPITPGDMGVSLSRPVRYAGSALGVWGKYKSAEDPLTAAGAVMSLGPAYSAELLARIARESFKKASSNFAPTPGAPTYQAP